MISSSSDIRENPLGYLNVLVDNISNVLEIKQLMLFLEYAAIVPHQLYLGTLWILFPQMD
jgi:hypothetical protein